MTGFAPRPSEGPSESSFSPDLISCHAAYCLLPAEWLPAALFSPPAELEAIKNMTSSLFLGTDVREDGASRRPASPDTAGRHERELIGPLIALRGLAPSGWLVGSWFCRPAGRVWSRRRVNRPEHDTRWRKPPAPPPGAPPAAPSCPLWIPLSTTCSSICLPLGVLFHSSSTSFVG